MLLLSIQVQRYFAQTEMLEIKRITFQVTVERLIADETNDYARRQLSENNFSWLTSL